MNTSRTRARSFAHAQTFGSRPVPASSDGHRTIRRDELRKLVPLSNTTIYEMERCGEFPRRFALTQRCVAWDLAEVEAWLEARKAASSDRTSERVPGPGGFLRMARPARTGAAKE
ncbi:helix-turn-helix transcriptional regulator [Caulobacter sp. KR2-114]|uniref:helix-turn-helix transcriptional regulator n=1 Tax=Caulobacter sp. KR2-114 TaxID=3400912 RepID=UPI003C0E7427